jgi:hypothetical protein
MTTVVRSQFLPVFFQKPPNLVTSSVVTTIGKQHQSVLRSMKRDSWRGLNLTAASNERTVPCSAALRSHFTVLCD